MEKIDTPLLKKVVEEIEKEELKKSPERLKLSNVYGDFQDSDIIKEALKGNEEKVNILRTKWYPPKEIQDYVHSKLSGTLPFGVPYKQALEEGMIMHNFSFEGNPGVILYRWPLLHIAVYQEIRRHSSMLAETAIPKFIPYIPAFHDEKYTKAKTKKLYRQRKLMDACKEATNEYLLDLQEAMPITQDQVRRAFAESERKSKEAHKKEVDLSVANNLDEAVEKVKQGPKYDEKTGLYL